MTHKKANRLTGDQAARQRLLSSGRAPDRLGSRPVFAVERIMLKTSRKPQTHCGTLDALPAALLPLTKLKRWVVWKWELTAKGKWTKPPYKAKSPTHNARNDTPSTWNEYPVAIAAYNNGADGIGFM